MAYEAPPTHHPDQIFLIVIRAEPALGATRIAAIMALIEIMSQKRSGMAFSIGDGTAFGVFATIARSAAQIRSALEARLPVQDKDFIIVLSLGREYSAIGNSAGMRHLQSLLNKS